MCGEYHVVVSRTEVGGTPGQPGYRITRCKSGWGKFADCDFERLGELLAETVGHSGGSPSHHSRDLPNGTPKDLSLEGMSTRQIGDVLGVGKSTVDRALESVANATPPAEPKTLGWPFF
jgi:hypothetical protein